jgi:hypothetical protein
MLTPFNCRNYITNLPQDADVVNIERADKNLRQSHHYLNVDVA